MGDIMKYKKLIMVLTGIFLVASATLAWSYRRHNLNENNKKLEVAKTAVNYLMTMDTFKNQVFEEAEVKYDSKMKMYIVSVKLENNQRKAVVFVSANNEISDVTQLK
jgi:hypothetical protein